VVYDTENASCCGAPENSSSSRRVSVVLPAPDGDETISRMPRPDAGDAAPAPDARRLAVTTRIIPPGLACAVRPAPRPCDLARPQLLDVLDLLADLLETRLGIDDRDPDLGGGRLGADRVELAADLLDQEVEAAADRALA